MTDLANEYTNNLADGMDSDAAMLATKSILQLVPNQVNIIIVRTEDEIQLYEGFPYDHGIDEASIYVVFIYARYLVTVWINGELLPHDRRQVSRQILHFMRYRATLM